MLSDLNSQLMQFEIYWMLGKMRSRCGDIERAAGYYKRAWEDGKELLRKRQYRCIKKMLSCRWELFKIWVEKRRFR